MHLAIANGLCSETATSRLGSGAPFYLTGVVEYLLAEIIEMAGNVSFHRVSCLCALLFVWLLLTYVSCVQRIGRAGTLTPLDIAHAIDTDDELRTLLSSYLFSVDAPLLANLIVPESAKQAQTGADKAKAGPGKDKAKVASADEAKAAAFGAFKQEDFSGSLKVKDDSEPYRLLFVCEERSRTTLSPIQYSGDKAVRELLDYTLRELLTTIVPDAMRFARWAQQGRAEVVVSGPHVSSALYLHPLLGDLQLLGCPSPSTAASQLPLFPLSRDVLTVMAGRIELDPTALAPAITAAEKTDFTPLKLLPASFVTAEVNRYFSSIFDSCSFIAFCR